MPPQTAALAADDAYATTGRLAWAMLRLVRLTIARDRCRLINYPYLCWCAPRRRILYRHGARAELAAVRHL